MTNTTTNLKPDHVVTLDDGRTIAIDEHGSPDGPAVVLVHCSPGSRLLDPDPAVTAAAGVRLITFDRAGFGDSSPVPDDRAPSVTDRADDVAAVLASLGIAEAAVVGWSHGGHIALAAAARHPDLVTSVALAGTPAPEDELPWVLPEQREMLMAMRADPSSARPQLSMALASFAEDPAVAIENSVIGDADEATYRAAKAAFDRYFGYSTNQGSEGLVCDIIAMHVTPWGFDPRAVGAPVHLFYGDGDVVVPPGHAAWWHEVLTDSAIRTVPGAGHLLVVPAWKDILAALA